MLLPPRPKRPGRRRLRKRLLLRGNPVRELIQPKQTAGLPARWAIWPIAWRPTDTFPLAWSAKAPGQRGRNSEGRDTEGQQGQGTTQVQEGRDTTQGQDPDTTEDQQALGSSEDQQGPDTTEDQQGPDTTEGQQGWDMPGPRGRKS